MAEMTMIQAITDGMRAEMERDETVLVMGEDVGVNGGVFRATEGLYQKFGENRVFDTPLAESGIIGSAIGLATQNFKPIAEIQFQGFVYVPMDQISSQAARLRFRSGGRFNVPMVIRSPFGGGVKAPEMHSDSLEALFLHTPGLKIVIPSNPYDAKGLLISAIRDPDPVLYFEPMRLYRSVKGEVPEEAYTVPLGKANVVKEGSDVTLIAYGTMVGVAEKAAAIAEQERGISAEVIDLRSIVPMDIETILASVKKTGRVIVVHEAVQSGGVAAEIMARINEEAILHLESPVLRVTGFDTPFPIPMIEDEWMPSAERVRTAIDQVLDF